MTLVDDRVGHLVRHLDGYSLRPEDLLEQVGDDYGRPLLVVATGSVLLGWANPHSDVDVDVVTDGADLFQLPIMSFKNEARIDVLYFTAEQWQERLARVRDQPWPPVEADRTTWVKMYRSLSNMTRFAVGYPLLIEPVFEDPFRSLSDPWMAECVERWWQIEAQRRWIVAERFLSTNPLVAASRYWDAITAALSAIVARRGQINMSSKWLPQKLQALGDDALLDELAGLLTFPSVDELPAYRAATESLVACAGAASGDLDAVVQLWPAAGVAGHRAGDRLFVSRWELRTVELERSNVDIEPGVPAWEGELGERPPVEIEALLLEDMLWMGLRAR